MSNNSQNLQIVEKAWKVWHEGMLDDHPDYGYRFEDLPIYYALSGSKAKVQCDIAFDFEIDGRSATFFDLRARRSKSSDKVMFKGEVTERYKAEIQIEVDNRNAELDEIQRLNPNSWAYISKRGYYYRPNSSGYTDRKTSAGVYTIGYAVACCKNSSPGDFMNPILIDVNEHNSMIDKEIEDLKTRRIRRDV